MPRLPPTNLKHDKTTDRAFVYWQGKKTYFGKWGSRDAAILFARWLDAAYSNKKYTPPAESIRIYHCVENYLEFAATYYSQDGQPTQEYRNIQSAMASLLTIAGDDRVSAFGPRRLSEVQSELAATRVSDEPSSKLKYSRNTINARINRIRRCLRWCASQEMIPVSVVTALELVPGLSRGRTAARETDAVAPVALSDVMATIPHMSPTVAVMVQVQLLCGMRPQDVCRMTTSAVDTSRDIWLYRPAAHKTSYRGQALVKAIPPAAQELLRPLLRDDPSAPVFSPVDSLAYWWEQARTNKKKAPPPPRDRKEYTTAAYGKSIVYAIDRAAKAGVTISRWSPNQLRHSIATHLREAIGIEAAQLFLGHSKPDTTTIYAEQSLAKLMEIARGLSLKLENSPEAPTQH